MIRNMLIIAGASFVLMLGCFAGVAALAGPVIMKEGWTIPFDDDDVTVRSTHIDLDSARPLPTVVRAFAWTGGDTLRLDVPSDVEFVQGPVGKIEVSGPKVLVEGLKIDGGVITLDRDGDRESLTIDRMGIRVMSDADRLKIVVTAPNVRKFELEGSGDLDIRDFDQPELSLSIRGSGDITGSGRTALLSVATEGSGSAYLSDIKAQDANVSIQGSGGARLAPKGKVQVDIAGSGDVEIESAAASVTSRITGSGSVHRED
jgi:carbon monoxide dehydrogenase subunit G